MSERKFHRAQALYHRAKNRKAKAFYLGIMARLDRELHPIESAPETVRSPTFDIVAESPDYLPSWHPDRSIVEAQELIAGL